MRLSLIIPAYNEAQRIRASLESAEAYFDRQGYDYEIIVVDDGSTDGTQQVVRDSHPEVHLESYGENRGKGYAVRHGMAVAGGDYRLFSDADGSTPIDELESFWPHLDDGADVVIASRALPDSDVELHQPWYRENMGRVFNLMLRAMRLTRFHDTQCGFKVFTRRAADIVFPRQTIDGFGFDPEILYIAEHYGLRIDEVPVHWVNCPYTRVNALTDSARMFGEMLQIRLNAWRGRYV